MSMEKLSSVLTGRSQTYFHPMAFLKWRRARVPCKCHVSQQRETVSFKNCFNEICSRLIPWHLEKPPGRVALKSIASS
jgi:hypothetical protein